MSIRAHVANFTAEVALPTGAITTQGRLTSVQHGSSSGRGDGSYKLCTADGVPVKRVYVDPTNDNAVVEEGNLRRYIEGSQKKGSKEPLVKKILTPEEYQAVQDAKKPVMPENISEITIHPISAAADLWPASEKNSYVFTVAQEGEKGYKPSFVTAYDTIRAILNTGKYALLTKCNIRNSEGFYRIVMWRGHIVFQPTIHTDALNPHVEAPPVDDEHLDKVAVGVAAALVQEFDAANYTDDRLARVRDAEATGATTGVSDAKRDATMEAMTALLENI